MQSFVTNKNTFFFIEIKICKNKLQYHIKNQCQLID